MSETQTAAPTSIGNLLLASVRRIRDATEGARTESNEATRAAGAEWAKQARALKAGGSLWDLTMAEGAVIEAWRHA